MECFHFRIILAWSTSSYIKLLILCSKIKSVQRDSIQTEKSSFSWTSKIKRKRDYYQKQKRERETKSLSWKQLISNCDLGRLENQKDGLKNSRKNIVELIIYPYGIQCFSVLSAPFYHEGVFQINKFFKKNFNSKKLIKDHTLRNSLGNENQEGCCLPISRHLHTYSSKKPIIQGGKSISIKPIKSHFKKGVKKKKKRRNL